AWINAHTPMGRPARPDELDGPCSWPATPAATSPATRSPSTAAGQPGDPGPPARSARTLTGASTDLAQGEVGPRSTGQRCGARAPWRQMAPSDPRRARENDSDRPYGLGLRAFVALHDGEFDPLVVAQFAEAVSLY